MGLDKTKKRNYNEVNKFVETEFGPSIQVTVVGSTTGSVYFFEGTNAEIEASIDALSHVINISMAGTGVAGSYLAAATILI